MDEALPFRFFTCVQYIRNWRITMFTKSRLGNVSWGVVKALIYLHSFYHAKYTGSSYTHIDMLCQTVWQENMPVGHPQNLYIQFYTVFACAFATLLVQMPFWPICNIVPFSASSRYVSLWLTRKSTLSSPGRSLYASIHLIYILVFSCITLYISIDTFPNRNNKRL